MNPAEYVLLKCKLSRGGFTSEAIFRVKLADGAEHIGAAPVSYCYSEHFKPLGPGQPKRSEPEDGYIWAQIVNYKSDNSVVVSVPSGEVLIVPRSAVIGTPPGKSNDVPLQPGHAVGN